jgi:hypothetical protein
MFHHLRCASYILLYPLIWLLAKSPDMAMQTVLHALFLPTPFKRALAHLASATAAAQEQSDATPAEKKAAAERGTERSSFIEILKPGALYRECSVVTLAVPPLPPAPEGEKAKDGPNAETGTKPKEEAKKNNDRKGKDTEPVDELLEIEQDGEYGGEDVGRLVWEWYEHHLREWEAKEKREKPELSSKEKESLGTTDEKADVKATRS